MKKILVVLAVLFTLPRIVNAEVFYAGDQVKEVPLYLDKITKQSYRYFKTAYRRSDNVLVYCVEPDKLLSVNSNYYYVENNQEKVLGISKEKWQRIESLAYFGYGYENHTDKKWAAITQYLIWQTVLPEGWFLTFTDGYGGEFKNIHEAETNEIESLIQEFETKPSFENQTFRIMKNNTLVLKDINNVLDKYKLVSNSELSVKILNNELHIEGLKNGNYILEFVRGEYKPTKLYLSEGDQSVVSTDGALENRFKINIVVESGNLKIKRNNDNYLENESTIENAVYEIIDSEQNKQIVTTDKNGEINLADLPVGEVVIRELTSSIGYEKDDKEYKINIKSDSEVILEINPKLIVKKLNIIKKYLVEEENILPDEIGSVFSVTKNNVIKLTDKTNKNGIVSFIIPYGHYTITQKSTILDYELMKDYNILVENSNEETLTFINYKKESPKQEFLPDNEVEIEIPGEEININNEKDIIKEENLDNEGENTEIKDKAEKDNENLEIEDKIENCNKSLETEEVVIENPKTGDYFRKYLSLLIISGLIILKNYNKFAFFVKK